MRIFNSGTIPSDLIQLKSDEFTYINTRYRQERFIDKDYTCLILSDDLDFVRVFVANANGKAERIYLKENVNEASCPFYSVEDAYNVFKGKKLNITNKLLVNDTHFKNKKR